ncbi:MAG: hypothetical protein AB1801_22920 [Chloroflexota bacterium]
MDYNKLAMGIDEIARQTDKRNIASLLELAQTASTVENPELYLAFFAFLISKYLPKDHSEAERLDFFRRGIEMLAIEADSHLTLVVDTCPTCGRHYLTMPGRLTRHYCEPTENHQKTASQSKN